MIEYPLVRQIGTCDISKGVPEQITAKFHMGRTWFLTYQICAMM